jgi:hypothetical protein
MSGFSIVDQYNNPFRGYLDPIGGDVVTEGRTYTQTIGALNAEVIIDLNGHATAAFDLRTAAASMTLMFEGSLDGTNYTLSLPGWDVQAEGYLSSVIIATTMAKVFNVGVTGLRKIRIRISTYVSGNVAVSARASVADYIIYGKQFPVIPITQTAAANAICTLTIPAGGVGLFHYIVGLFISRTSTAALAGTATLVVTSTNLPNSLAWSVGNAMIAGATSRDIELSFGVPMKSSAANTNTTIVAPAPGAAVLWRINAYYYLGA